MLLREEHLNCKPALLGVCCAIEACACYRCTGFLGFHCILLAVELFVDCCCKCVTERELPRDAPSDVLQVATHTGRCNLIAPMEAEACHHRYPVPPLALTVESLLVSASPVAECKPTLADLQQSAMRFVSPDGLGQTLQHRLTSLAGGKVRGCSTLSTGGGFARCLNGGHNDRVRSPGCTTASHARSI